MIQLKSLLSIKYNATCLFWGPFRRRPSSVRPVMSRRRRRRRRQLSVRPSRRPFCRRRPSSVRPPRRTCPEDLYTMISKTIHVTAENAICT